METLVALHGPMSRCLACSLALLAGALGSVASGCRRAPCPAALCRPGRWLASASVPDRARLPLGVFALRGHGGRPGWGPRGRSPLTRLHHLQRGQRHLPGPPRVPTSCPRLPLGPRARA